MPSASDAPRSRHRPRSSSSQSTVIVITSRYSPHKLVFLTIAIILGVVYLLGVVPPPTGLATQIPRELIRPWAVAMLLHGLACVIGVLAPPRHIRRGLEMELGGMLVGAAVLLASGVAAFVTAGRGAALGGSLMLGWCLANGIRAAQCRRDVRHLDRKGHA